MATTSSSIAQLLGTAATAYGVLAALSVLLQARQMLARRASCEVSGRFFASYAGGYAIWLLYGLSVSNVPLIVVDAVGLLCAGLTLAVALSLRGSLIHPTTWTSCNAIPVSEESSELVMAARTPSLWACSRPAATQPRPMSGYEVRTRCLAPASQWCLRVRLRLRLRPCASSTSTSCAGRTPRGIRGAVEAAARILVERAS